MNISLGSGNSVSLAFSLANKLRMVYARDGKMHCRVADEGTDSPDMQLFMTVKDGCMQHGWLNGRFKKPSAGGGEDSQSFSDWGYIVTGKTTRGEGMILVGGDASLTL